MPENWQNKDKDYIWHPFAPLAGGDPNIVIEKAAGVYFYTDDGRKIMDAVASWWVNLHGHSHPYMVKAIQEQVAEMDHVIFAGFTHRQAVRLGERVLDLLPGDFSKLFYSDDGSTAVEVGIKMAVQYWHNKGLKKQKIIAIEGAYHGDTFGAMAAAARTAFNEPFWPMLFEVEHIPFPNGDNDREVINTFEKLVQADAVAAFIYEPLLQGAAGMRMYSVETLDKLIGLAKQHQVICIADEVLTGFGRTGKIFASEHMDHKPDIVAMAKGITGGVMSLGATACTRHIEEAFQSADWDKTFFHGHSFTANSIACAAGNASMDLLLGEECQSSIVRINQAHEAFANEIRSNTSIKEVRILGTVIAIEFNTGEGSSYFNNLRDRLYQYFLSRDILLRPLGNVIYILPPYVITNEELQVIYKAIKAFLKE